MRWSVLVVGWAVLLAVRAFSFPGSCDVPDGPPPTLCLPHAWRGGGAVTARQRHASRAGRLVLRHPARGNHAREQFRGAAAVGGGAVNARPASSRFPPSSCYAGVTSAASSPWRLLERLLGRFCHSRLPVHLFARQSRLCLADTPSQYSGTVTFTTISGLYSHSSHCHPLPPFGSPPAALHSASSPLSLFTLLTPSLPNWVFHPLPHTFFPRY